MAIQRISITQQTLGESAYQHLFRGFLNNELVPGTRLLMDELAEQMGISRTPVREALQRLEYEGVIEARGRRGYVVREATAEELDHRYQAREAIEGFATRAVTSAGGDMVKELRKQYEATLQLPQTTAESVFQANYDFHRSIVAVLENALLVESFDLVWKRSLTSGIWVRMLDAGNAVAEFDAKHRGLLEAIESGDVEHADKLMLAHIREGRGLHEF